MGILEENLITAQRNFFSFRRTISAAFVNEYHASTF